MPSMPRTKRPSRRLPSRDAKTGIQTQNGRADDRSPIFVAGRDPGHGVMAFAADETGVAAGEIEFTSSDGGTYTEIGVCKPTADSRIEVIDKVFASTTDSGIRRPGLVSQFHRRQLPRHLGRRSPLRRQRLPRFPWPREAHPPAEGRVLRANQLLAPLPPRSYFFGLGIKSNGFNFAGGLLVVAG
jgi:hypothetical protein